MGLGSSCCAQAIQELISLRTQSDEITEEKVLVKKKRHKNRKKTDFISKLHLGLRTRQLFGSNYSYSLEKIPQHR